MLAISMVFVVAALMVILGSYYGYVTLNVPRLRSVWLVLLALILWAILYKYNAHPLPKFLTTQIIILTFVAINHRIPGFKLLFLGLLANAIPALTNGEGGLMPVAAELMPYLVSEEVKWEVYKRIGWSVVLPANEINFYWLSDWILIHTVGKAYSPGDIVILTSGLWLLIKIVIIPQKQEETHIDEKGKG